jgi:hypothetical protein
MLCLYSPFLAIYPLLFTIYVSHPARNSKLETRNCLSSRVAGPPNSEPRTPNCAPASAGALPPNVSLDSIVYNFLTMTRKIWVCLFCCAWAARAFCAGPFAVRLDPPASAREWEEGVITLTVTGQASDQLLMAGVLPPDDDKYVRLSAGPVSTSAEADGKQVWTYQFRARFLKEGNYDLKPFKIQYLKQPSESEQTDKKVDAAEQKPEEQEVGVPAIHVKARFFWKRMGFWYGAGAAFVVFIAIYFVITRRKSKGGLKHG